MKKIKPQIILLIVLFLGSNLYSQCLNQLYHTSGTIEINGIQVTASSTGWADSTTFCMDAQPYYIGGDGDGSYTFQFSTPIESMSMNITSIHNDSGGTYEEVVRIDVNGDHYSIPAVGGLNSCSPTLAILTPEGDLAAQPTSQRAGTNDLIIPGPISEITVTIIALVGNGGGSIFSLFFCAEETVSTDEIDASDLQIFPLPASDQITIKSNSNSIGQVYLLDQLGRKLNPFIDILSNEATVDISNFSSGLYYAIIHINNQIITRKIIVE